MDRPATLERAVEDLYTAKTEGLQTLLGVDSHDQGRDIKLQAEVSRRSGINIVVATGTWLEIPRFFMGAHPDKIADLYVREIEDGIEGTEVRTGVIKVSSDRDGVNPQEELVLRAAVRAAKRTGIPMTHT